MIGEYIEIANGIKFGASDSVGNLPAFAFAANITPYKASIIANNNEVCTLEGKIGKSNFETLVAFSDEKYFIKSFGQNNSIDSIKVGINALKTAINESYTAMISSMLPKIYDVYGNEIGNCEMLFAGEGLQKYSYFKYTIKNNILYAYELSHDTSDILYCIYNSYNQMIATISKKTFVKNGLARYTIYACNEAWFKYAALITACWSIKYTEEDGAMMSVSKQSLITLNQELLSKYNPTFIDQVKQKVGINNLPENMTLVNEKVVASKNTTEMKLSKIVLIISLIIIGIVLFMALKFTG